MVVTLSKNYGQKIASAKCFCTEDEILLGYNTIQYKNL